MQVWVYGCTSSCSSDWERSLMQVQYEHTHMYCIYPNRNWAFISYKWFNPAFIRTFSAFYIGVYLCYSTEPLHLFRPRCLWVLLYLDKYGMYISTCSALAQLVLFSWWSLWVWGDYACNFLQYSIPNFLWPFKIVLAKLLWN